MLDQKQTSRSSIQPETLNPTWEEYFAFWIDPASDESKAALSVACMDHDTMTPDDPLGTFDVPLKSIPRDKTTEKFYTLQGVKTGEVCLSIRRATLTSPELKYILSVRTLRLHSALHCTALHCTALILTSRTHSISCTD